MKQRTDVDAVGMVRRIRDRQASELRGRSDEEIIAYFRAAVKLPSKRAVRQRRATEKPVSRRAGRRHHT